MSENIDKRVENFYSLILERPNEVLEVFNSFYGSSNVDMQGIPSISGVNYLITERIIPEDIIDNNNIEDITNRSNNILNYIDPTILVHFPKVTITNENNKSLDITHLFVKVKINVDGTIRGSFSLNRSEYTTNELYRDYMHSHVNGIPTNDFTCFKSPCLGNGPIRNTIATLSAHYDLDVWRLFCLELNKYVQVESLEGIPYRYLERVNSSGYLRPLNTKYKVIDYFPFNSGNRWLKGFVEYYIINNNLKFNFVNGNYSIGMPFKDYILDISNSFINWYNNHRGPSVDYYLQDLIITGLLIKVSIEGNDIQEVINNNRPTDNSYSTYQGSYVCTFKGESITLNIRDVSIEENYSHILNIDLSLYILRLILLVINYNYGKNSETNRTNQEIYYL